jgi:multidrug efflux system outer membrane protein
MKRLSMTVSACVALVGLLGASGCSMIPKLEQSGLAVSNQWGAPEASLPSTLTPEQLAWSSYFADARLQALIKQALSTNRDLRVAVLNIEQTRAAYQIARADQFPTLNAAVNATRQPATTPPNRVGTVATGGLSLASFEIDLFGRVQALTEAAAAQLLATEEARKAAQISLVGAIASSYYALWADQWQLALAEQTLSTREASFKLLKLKYDNGVLNELELRSGQSLVEAARIARAQGQRQVQLDLNALTLLVGAPVEATQLPPTPMVPVRAADELDAIPQITQASQLWPALTPLPVGLPSEVLLKRPDIAQAEQLLVAANANIGAARAARFPRINLTASAGVASDSLSGLFSDGRSAWSLGGGLTAPLFDMGRAAANVTVSEVKRDVALAQYDKAIQTAFREVSDALVSRSTYGDQVQSQQAQVDAEAARLKLSGLRYRSGVASQLDLLDAQRSLFSAQQALISTELARQQAQVSVFKALGGGLTP